MKKFISIILIMLCIIPTSMVHAYTASNVPSYLFDANYYSEMYDDLKAAFGTNRTKLYNHWCNYGKKEGRSPSPVYNPSYYVNNNADLKKAFGNDYIALYNHFCTYGINEYRASSELYNGSYYKNTYGDLQDAFGNTSKKYLEHFMNYGMKEGRQANPNFNVLSYKSNYADLRNAFGNNMKAYYYHYMKYGISEGRTAAGTTTPTNPTKSNFNTNTDTAITNATSNLINSNLSKIRLIKQGSKTCKATAVAQSLNIIVGSNKYTTGSLGNVPCKNIGGSTYKGSDGNTYVATYKQDSYVGSRAEQQAQIDKSLSAGLPIVVTVHKTTSGTKHHWVTVIGKTGNTYDIIDPATGTKRTMTSAKYDFGLADYSNGKHYGYVSFTKK